MKSKIIEDLLNRQVEREAYSSHLYLAIASWAENQGMEGSAKWFYAQSDEEREHMLRFIQYINERDGKAIISKLEQPPTDFGNINKAFEEALKHEKFITDSINEIVAACEKEKDYTTHNWIQWFVTEQIEEEATVKSIIDKLNLIGDHNLYMFDRDIMAMRTSESPEE
ncbi:MAG: ferritin [Bacteroidales bacterium]